MSEFEISETGYNYPGGRVAAPIRGWDELIQSGLPPCNEGKE